ncbi:MAG: Rieske (2Fe-2S) protein [Pontibacterium sp.]
MSTDFLCHTHDVEEGDARGFMHEGVTLIVAHREGSFYVYKNRCPHRSIPLEWNPDQFLDTDRNFIQCSTHGALFRIEDGLCVTGPCVNDRLESVRFYIEDDKLKVGVKRA